MDIFLFHWDGTSQSWEAMRPGAWLIVLEMFTLRSDKNIQETRMHSSRMRTHRTLQQRGVSLTPPDRQTPVKT